VKDNPVSSSDPLGLLVRGHGWSDQEWNDIESAAARIRAELSKGCTCTKKGMGTCVPCNLVPALLNSLDTMTVSYASLSRLDGKKLVQDCGFTPPLDPPRGLLLSRVPWGKVPGQSCKPGCLASTLYHELLHTTNQIFDDSDPPAAFYERECIGDLRKKGSP
jgi:hypothetical protein